MFSNSKMPFDHKRINGPEISFNYAQFVEKSEDDKQTLELSGKREDGRTFDEHRKFGKI